MPLDELKVPVQGGHRGLELVTRRGHQALQAEPHRALGEVPDRQDAAPGPVPRGERFDDCLEPAPTPPGLGHREFHAEPLAPGGPLLRSVGRRNRQAGRVLGLDLGPSHAKEPIVGVIGRHDPALVVDCDDRVAEAGQDRSQTIVLLLDAQPLLL